jgi:deoxyribonuclease V
MDGHYTEDQPGMTIAAFDVHYLADGCASAAALLFAEYKDAEPLATFTQFLSVVANYIPGEFYRRELPCIITLFEQFTETPDELIIDGYVMLGNRPGLGQYLFKYFNGKIPVVGVAKTKFEGSEGIKVFRGGSAQPLYVTAAGVNLFRAAESIRTMHGNHRIPTLLKQVDRLARAKAHQGAQDF